VPRYELDGKVAVITGAARGIGRGIALRLAREGCEIAVLDLDDADATIRAAGEYGHRALALRADVTRRGDVQAAIDHVVHELSRVDILVNDAGLLEITPVLEITDDEWDRHMAINATAVFLCSQIAARQMVAQGGGGRIITIVSSAGRIPSKARIASYVASKHAAMGLVQQMGWELAPHGILVNAVFPGSVDTRMLEYIHRTMAEAAGKTYEELREADEASIPAGRFETPEDVANMVAFLASSDASYTAGQIFDVGGGAFFY
jgi:meso-butanediol dehydrogenase / (S,S)-butanediol dehydrogenase / diacetyl reductase